MRPIRNKISTFSGSQRPHLWECDSFARCEHCGSVRSALRHMPCCGWFAGSPQGLSQRGPGDIFAVFLVGSYYILLAICNSKEVASAALLIVNTILSIIDSYLLFFLASFSAGGRQSKIHHKFLLTGGDGCHRPCFYLNVPVFIYQSHIGTLFSIWKTPS